MITDVVPSNIPLDDVFIPNIAKGLASLGRFEDTYMVHAAKGETVIPKQVLDANPGLKESCFSRWLIWVLKTRSDMLLVKTLIVSTP